MRVTAIASVVLLCAVSSLAAQGTTSGTSTYNYTPWEPTQWSQLEWRARCEGGLRGVEAGPPIRWTVEFRNRSKEHPISFTYTIAPPPEGGNKASASGRQTLKPRSVWGTVAIVDVERCGWGIRTAVGKVKYGEDADSVSYAPPDRS